VPCDGLRAREGRLGLSKPGALPTGRGTLDAIGALFTEFGAPFNGLGAPFNGLGEGR